MRFVFFYRRIANMAFIIHKTKRCGNIKRSDLNRKTKRSLIHFFAALLPASKSEAFLLPGVSLSKAHISRMSRFAGFRRGFV